MKSNSNHQVKVSIDSYTSELFGTGTLDGKEYLFPYVQIGDIIYFREIGKGKYKKNQIIQIEKQEPEFSAKCKHFGFCGGCRAQQIPYNLQFELKVNELKNYYHTGYGIAPQLTPAKKIWNYRNRMDFVVTPTKVGLRQEGNYKKIIDISTCEIQSQKANQELQKIKDFLKTKPDIAYDRVQKKGCLKYVTIRTNLENSELMLILTFIDSAYQSSLTIEIAEFLKQTSLAENIVFCYNRERAEVSAQGKFEVIRGNYFFHEKVFDKIIQIPFDSFFQPNLEGFYPILKFIQDKLENLKLKKLLDLFCGIGFFSIIFGDKFQIIEGFDCVLSSVEHANLQLKRMYPQKKINFQVLDLYKIEENCFQSEENTIAILDPPRSGLGKNMLKILGNSNIPVLFYVSCNPHIQRLDFEYLSEFYKLHDMLITDPYPHTPHLESVMYLERKL